MSSSAAHISTARLVIVASSDPHVTRLVVERALAANPAIDFVVRTHSDTEAAHLRAISGRVQAVHGERELAVQMVRYALRRFGVDLREAEAIAQGIRRLSAPVTPPTAADARAVGTLGRWRDRIGGLLGGGTSQAGEP